MGSTMVAHEDFPGLQVFGTMVPVVCGSVRNVAFDKHVIGQTFLAWLHAY